MRLVMKMTFHESNDHDYHEANDKHTFNAKSNDKYFPEAG